MNIHYSNRMTLNITSGERTSASINPMETIIKNKPRTYFGAFDVIANILLGSKFLSIENLYIY